MLVEPAIATFQFNKVTVGILCGLAGLYALVFIPLLIENGLEPFFLTFVAIIFGPLGLCIAWLLSVRVSFHSNGMYYRSLFRSRAILWDEIDRFYYRALNRSVNFVPIGTWFGFKLLTKDNKRLSFGNRVERPAEVGERLIEATQASLLQWTAQRFDQGAELDFGPVRLAHATGLKIKGLFGTVIVPLDSVVDYRIEGGSLHLWSAGRKRPTSIAIWKVPNVFVLIRILDVLFPRREAAKEG